MEPKFNLDRPKVSDDEINKHKDFNNLVKQFKEQSIQKARSDVDFLKNKKATYATVIAGIAVICTVTYFTVFKNQTQNTKIANDKTTTLNENKIAENKSTAKKPFVAPPTKKLNVPYSTYKVNSSKGGEVAHHTESKIKVPKSAFVNKSGEEIIGDVEIQYREMHDQADIIASGVPMTYDSAGTKYHFESAGMFDIKASQNGEQVFLKHGKQITVEMISRQAADSYNQYYLDTVAQNWVVIKHDTPIADKRKPPENHSGKKTEEPKQIVNLQKKIEHIPVQVDSVKTVYTKKINKLPAPFQPNKPAKASGKPQFELEVDYKEFPELSAFKNAVFEVGSENKNYTKELHQITWNSALVSEGPQKGKNYLLTLKSRNRVEKLVVYPVLSEADYNTAYVCYENKFSEYKKLVEKKEAEELKLKQEMEAKQKAYMDEQKKLSEELVRQRVRFQQQQEALLTAQSGNLNNIQKVTRIFQVSNFGIYNSDCPKTLPSGADINVSYAFNENSTLVSPRLVYVIEHGKNQVYTYDGATIYNLKYNPGTEYSLCAVVNGQLYIYSKEQFAAMAGEKKKKLILTALPEHISDVADLRKALEI